jgi:hypothetical protein
MVMPAAGEGERARMSAHTSPYGQSSEVLDRGVECLHKIDGASVVVGRYTLMASVRTAIEIEDVLMLPR